MESQLNPGGTRGVKTKYVQTSSGVDFVVYGSTAAGAITEIYRLKNCRAILPADGAALLNKRQRVTLVQANAGVTVLPAVVGFKYRIVSYRFIAIGGNAGGGTSLDVIATQGASTVRPFVAPIALLTRSRIVDEDSVVEASPDNVVTILADGASHNEFDANTAVTVGKQSGGSDLTTATNFDVILDYVLVAA